MKKLLIALLVFCLLICFSACDNKDGEAWESNSRSTDSDTVSSDAAFSDTVESDTQTTEVSNDSKEDPKDTGSVETTPDNWTNNY